MRIIVSRHGELWYGEELGPIELAHALNLRRFVVPGVVVVSPDSPAGIQSARTIVDYGDVRVAKVLDPISLEDALGPEGPERMRQLYEFVAGIKQEGRDVLLLVGVEIVSLLLFALGLSPDMLDDFTFGSAVVFDPDTRVCRYDVGPHG